MFFEYGDTEINYLKKKDKRLGQVIDQMGHIYRRLDTDLFSAVVHHIIGQQISAKAHKAIWTRILNELGTVDARSISSIGLEEVKSLGMTYRKAIYIKDFADKVCAGSFDVEALRHKSDQEAIDQLTTLKGIGTWTAEMILLFCLNRLDIFSFNDLVIHRGLWMVYHHKKVPKALFDRYKKRFSPYGSVASLYLWAWAGGEIEKGEHPLIA
ncbi:MAG: DNA-3-methyladenine glycosylase 2 family protein [Burkholderiales bacterium]|nr:DNA-3-methyladenine glycosylase 2 family protein [Burkholderiales bacterium]